MGLYNAEISCWFPHASQSRRIAALLRTQPSKDQWLAALTADNILQKRTPATVLRQARCIRYRLDTLDEEAWAMIADGSHEVATQMLLAAAIKHSRILADFMRSVVAGRLHRLEQHLSPASDWESFLADCSQRDPDVAAFSASTKAKMLQVVLRVLAEARYIDSIKILRLTPPHLHPDVVAYLRRHNESSVLATMDLTQ